jgi:hypothetical protein
MKKQIFLAVVMSVMCCVDAKAQSWWRGFPKDSSFRYFFTLTSTEDGSFIMRNDKVFNSWGTTQMSFYISEKIDPKDGRVLKADTTYDIGHGGQAFTMNDKGLLYLAASTDSFYYNQFSSDMLPQPLKITRRDSLNRLLSLDSIVSLKGIGCNTFTKRNDSIFATVGTTKRTWEAYPTMEFIIFNPLNKTISSKRRVDSGSIVGMDVFNNNYLLFYSRRDTLFRVEINAQGNIQNRRIYSTFGINYSSYYYYGGLKLTKDKQNNYYILSEDGLTKFSANGDFIWKKNTYFTFLNRRNERSNQNSDMKILPNGDFIISQRIIDLSGNDKNVGIYKINSRGDSLWWKLLPVNSAVMPYTDVNLTNDGGILLSGFAYLSEFTANQWYGGRQLIRLDANGDIKFNVIQGEIKKDDNNNCRLDATDTEARVGIVEATREDGQVYTAYVNSNSNKYSLFCDTGNYTIKLITPNGLWQQCTLSVSRRISTMGTTDTVNFLLKSVANCPALEVDISNYGFSRCYPTALYVSYYNKGTSVATNAYVDVRLDSLLEFTGSTRPFATRNNNFFRFNLGSIAIGERGWFTINARVRCGDSTRLGQTLCNEAHIYPDSVCLPMGTFSGANLTVSGSCIGDSVQFVVKNVGTATSQNARSVVLEDEVLFMRNNINGLTPNATFTKKYKANGGTWRMILEQEPNHPTSQFPTAFVEGCGRNTGGGVSTGFGTAFGNDDAAPSVSTLCRAIVGSYDPNDKQGFPTGYKSEHFIRQNQDLDYVIRFQNTGTDTAFLVVIRDTLSDVLDLPSIEFGGSSHAYEADIYGKNIVKFTFKNINLPDSFRNVAASQGFVKFRIKQKKDLPIGTKINNKAGIYFDFNDPIITNTTLHTVAKDLVITAIIESSKTPNSLTINVLPNPFSEHATFELLASAQPFNSESNQPTFQLYDALGRLLRSEKITNARFDFQRRDLASGLYFFNITSNGKVLGQGKLVIQ